MPLTGAHLRTILASYGALGNQIADLDTLAAEANEAMRLGGMNTVNRCAGFLSQAIMESAYLRTTSEYGGASTRYAPYYGRTFIQLTWRENYAGFGAWCKARGLVSDANYFVNNPSALSQVKWGWLGGVYYFTARRNWSGITSLVELCDRGDIVEISRAVNCGNPFVTYGPGGITARRTLFDAARKIGPAIVPSGSAPKPASGHADTGQDLSKHMSKLRITQLQQALHVSPADGIPGPDTVNALIQHAGYAREVQPTLSPAGSNTIRKMQTTLILSEITKANIVPDGILGSQTDAQIEKYMHGGGRFTNLAKMPLTAPKSPTVKPVPKPVTKPGAAPFPLPRGDWFGPDDGTIHSHSGARKSDLKWNKLIQGKVGVTADGWYGNQTAAAMRKWQSDHKLHADGLCGPVTWKSLKI